MPEQMIQSAWTQLGAMGLLLLCLMIAVRYLIRKLEESTKDRKAEQKELLSEAKSERAEILKESREERETWRGDIAKQWDEINDQSKRMDTTIIQNAAALNELAASLKQVNGRKH